MQLKEAHIFEEKGLNITIFSILSEVQDLINNFFDASQRAAKKDKKKFVDISDISSKIEAPQDFFLICFKRRMWQKF